MHSFEVNIMHGTTQRLMAEHEEINSVLNTLFRAIRLERSGTFLGARFWRDAIDFIRGFSDEFHHAKEENILFPVYCENGMQDDYGPVAVMLKDHENFRSFLKIIEESLSQGEEDNIKRWQATGNFIEGLRFHIHKENNILYPMGEEILSREDEDCLMQIFDLVEETLGGSSTVEHYRKLAQSLEERVVQAFDGALQTEAN
ncbi:MAG TPA: hypothetical protein D7H97_01285 [Candidatus Poseidoniales archaeon]|nr:MAG TPA: hypothetical protein D7H97_01285 [Candidatus Poseidoniales archaeon]|tara:strand:- start:4425 stop:5027 length:603 start_codon:yes stop_codon:yes gene_type:complete